MSSRASSFSDPDLSQRNIQVIVDDEEFFRPNIPSCSDLLHCHSAVIHVILGKSEHNLFVLPLDLSYLR